MTVTDRCHKASQPAKLRPFSGASRCINAG